MIKILAGGKKNMGWGLEAISEYEKRLRKPFDITWQFMEEDKLSKYLEKWPFDKREFVICCDERGKNISSGEFSQMLEKIFLDGKDIIVLIGGAYGFDDRVREKADFIWGFSKLVFPHALARLIATEQIYRAQEIGKGGKYHHE